VTKSEFSGFILKTVIPGFCEKAEDVNESASFVELGIEDSAIVIYHCEEDMHSLGLRNFEFDDDKFDLVWNAGNCTCGNLVEYIWDAMTSEIRATTMPAKFMQARQHHRPFSAPPDTAPCRRLTPHAGLGRSALAAFLI